MTQASISTFAVHSTGRLIPKRQRYGTGRLTVDRITTTDGRPRATVVLHNADDDRFGYTTMDREEAFQLAEALKAAVQGEWACYSCAAPISW